MLVQMQQLKFCLESVRYKLELEIKAVRPKLANTFHFPPGLLTTPVVKANVS